MSDTSTRQESIMDNLEKLGYIATAVKNSVDSSWLVLKNSHQQNIGNIDITGNINLYTAVIYCRIA